jgi:uncharacterized protein YbaP (TraB family)
LVETWKAGNAHALGELIFSSFQEFPVLKAKLFEERNQRWIQKIEPWLQDNEDYLIIVGAGHLLGEGSVIQLLQKKGYIPAQL